MPKPVVVIVSLALGVACAGLVSCGGDDEGEGRLPQGDADDLLAQLQVVEDNVDVGSCQVAERETSDLSQRVEELPKDVDPELREALSDGTERLGELLSNPGECEPETTPTETEVTETEVTETEVTETEEPPTETEVTETETTTPTTPTAPSGQDGDTGGTPNGSGGSGL